MAYRRSNDTTIQANVLNAIQPKISVFAQQLDNAMDECYNDELLEKVIIGR